jgi:Ras-related protein Rab-32
VKEGLVQNKDQMDRYAEDKGFAAWYETSAKDNLGIEDAAHCLIRAVLKSQTVRIV